MNSSAVSSFSNSLDRLFDRALCEAAAEKSYSAQREKAWTKYHQLRCTDIHDLHVWKVFISDQLRLKDYNPLLVQTIIQELFESKMKSYLPSQSLRKWPASQESTPDLSDDEKNTLLYACGYVPVVLLKKYKKQNDQNSTSYVECLINMAVGTFEDSFYDYCRKWLEEINRGGVFEVSDEAYNFFLAVEMNVRSSLMTLLREGSCQATEDQRKILLQRMLEDEDILFFWSLVSVDCDGSLSIELLREILALWVTIRGYSIAGCWMEQYKRLSQVTGKAALHKEMKRKKMESEG